MSEPESVSNARKAQALAERTARAMLERDHASRALGISVVEMHPGYARLTMTVRQDMVNGHDICHGGILFTLADSAFAFACNSRNHLTVAAGAVIDYLLPARLGEVLTATAEERSRSRRTGVYDVRLTNEAGRCIALFRGRSHQLDGHLVEE